MERIACIVTALFKVALLIFVLEMVFFVHEYGHLAEMQKQNIPIKELALGVGPKIVGWKMNGYEFNIRIIPIMAYVAPTDAGEKALAVLPAHVQFKVFFAGVRNNFVIGLLGIYILYWIHNARVRHAPKIGEILFVPVQLVMVLGEYLASFLSLGRLRIERPHSFAFTACGRSQFEFFVVMNLYLFALNILPVAFVLDGGKIFYALCENVFPSLFWRLYHEFSIYVFLIFFVFGRSELELITLKKDR